MEHSTWYNRSEPEPEPEPYVETIEAKLARRRLERIKRMVASTAAVDFERRAADAATADQPPAYH